MKTNIMHVSRGLWFHFHHTEKKKRKEKETLIMVATFKLPIAKFLFFMNNWGSCEGSCEEPLGHRLYMLDLKSVLNLGLMKVNQLSMIIDLLCISQNLNTKTWSLFNYNQVCSILHPIRQQYPTVRYVKLFSFWLI